MNQVLLSVSGTELKMVPVLDKAIHLDGLEIHVHQFFNQNSENAYCIVQYNDLNDIEALENVFMHLSQNGNIPEGISFQDFDFNLGEAIQLYIDFRISLPGFKIYINISGSGDSSKNAIYALKMGFDGIICSKILSQNADFSEGIHQYLSSTKNLSPEENKEMARHRNRIDEIDNEIIDLLASRFDEVKSLAAIKSGSHIPIVQPERWNQILKDVLSIATQKGLLESFIREIFNAIHMESIQKHLE